MGLDELLVIVLQQNLLGSPSADERAEGLGILMEKVSVTYGAAGSNLGHLLRASGVPVPLTALLSDVDLAMRNQALWIIGNLCSDSVDVDSALTKQALMAAGADKVLFRCLDEEATLELACAALQNLCHDPRWAPRHPRSRQPAPLREPAAARPSLRPERGPERGRGLARAQVGRADGASRGGGAPLRAGCAREREHQEVRGRRAAQHAGAAAGDAPRSAQGAHAQGRQAEAHVLSRVASRPGARPRPLPWLLRT